MLSRLSISIRHFTVPIVLLILLIAPLPRLLASLRVTSPIIARVSSGLTAICVLSCLFTAARTYPFYMPYINALSFGRPAYTLLNDSNVDWNQALPEVRRFAEAHAIDHLKIDEYGMVEVTDVVPNGELWNCQKASAADAGSVFSTDTIARGCGNSRCNLSPAAACTPSTCPCRFPQPAARADPLHRPTTASSVASHLT
jgi:hypothetical protein